MENNGELQPFWKLISLFANLHMTRNITVKFLEVWNKFNNFCTMVTMATSAILNVISTPKASTPRYQNNAVGWRPLLVCNGNSSYVTPTPVGWRIAILHFFFIIILPHIFVRSISRRCLNQTLWNVVGISYGLIFIPPQIFCGLLCYGSVIISLKTKWFSDLISGLMVSMVPCRYIIGHVKLCF
jgi:hypothetical protein